MARSINEIYDSLNVVKASMQELHDYVVSTDIPGSVQDDSSALALDIKSTSKVAVWRLWLWIMAVASWVVENLFDQHKAEITSLLSEKKPHTLRWYAEESKKYQYGYALAWEDNQYSYNKIDTDAKIIKYAAASENNGIVIIKVAKETGGVKSPLSLLEKSSFTEFWRQWKDAGVKLTIISQPADILQINLTIVRDRLVLNSNNSLLRNASVFPIEDAINAYASSLEFDGVIMLSKLVDAIQKAEGVIDVQLNSALHKPDGGTYAPVSMSVVSVSGYFIIDLDSTINYIDNIQVEIYT